MIWTTILSILMLGIMIVGIVLVAHWHFTQWIYALTVGANVVIVLLLAIIGPRFSRWVKCRSSVQS